MLFSILYTLLATYTEIKYQLKQYFYFFNMNIKYDELFLQNGVFSIFTQSHLTP